MEKSSGFSLAVASTTATGSLNIGGFSDPTADKLIKASTTSSNPDAVKAEAAYLTQVQPSLFQPAVDSIEVWKTNISGPPTSFETLTQYQLNPEFWYFTKK